MNSLTTYYNQLLQQIEIYLKKEYNSLGTINFEQFDKVNFYLIDKALSKNQNLHIKTIQTTEKSNFYVPIVLSTALSLFFKNYCNSQMIYNVGDIVDKAGLKFIIEEINSENYLLKRLVKNGTATRVVEKNKISEYQIVEGHLSTRKSKDIWLYSKCWMIFVYL